MALTRRSYLVIFLVLALAAAGTAYWRHHVRAAIAGCDAPAPPTRPATPPPNLPGFQSGAACGPGEVKR